jgi:hypothetical protein
LLLHAPIEGCLERPNARIVRMIGLQALEHLLRGTQIAAIQGSLGALDVRLERAQPAGRIPVVDMSVLERHKGKRNQDQRRHDAKHPASADRPHSGHGTRRAWKLDDALGVGLHGVHEVESIGGGRFSGGPEADPPLDNRFRIAGDRGQLVLETERAKPVSLLQQFSASSTGN